MRLGTYILIISATVVTLVLVVQSVQTGTIVRDGFDELSNTQVQKISEHVRAIMNSKREHLESLAYQIISRADLGDALVFSMMTRDFIPLHQTLGSIREKSKLDFADIIFPDGKAINLNDKKLALELTGESGTVSDRFSVAEIDKNVALITTIPIPLGEKRDAVLVLGYFLNEAVKKRISELTNSHKEVHSYQNLSLKRRLL